MVRTSECILCGVSLRCKDRGNTKKYCKHCTYAKFKYDNDLYRSKHRIQIRNQHRIYRESHRATIRLQSTNRYLKLKRMKKHYDQKLLDDVLRNPRKYLKRVKVK